MPSDIEPDKLLDRSVDSETALNPNNTRQEVLTCNTLWSVIWSTISGFQFGWHLGVINTPRSVIVECTDDANSQGGWLPNCLPMDDLQWGLVAGLLCIGGLVGAFVGGFACRKIGRKTTQIYMNGFFLLGGMCMALSWSPAMLMVSRFILGIGCGIASSASPMYIAEVSTNYHRGRLGALNQLMITLAILASQAFGILLSSASGWRILFALTIIPALLQMALSPTVAESPRYLISKGLYVEGKDNLIYLRNDETVATEEFDVLYEACQASHTERHMSLADLLRVSSLRTALIIASTALFAQQFSAINGVIMFSTTIFEKLMGEGHDQANILTLIIGGVNVFITIVSVYLIDRLGRRVLLLFSQYSTALTLGIIVIGSVFKIEVLVAVSIAVLVCCFAVGLGPIPWLLLPELFPTYAVAPAASVCNSVSWISNFIVGFSFLKIQDVLQSLTFLPFCIISLVCAIIINILLPEPNGKTFEEISALLE